MDITARLLLTRNEVILILFVHFNNTVKERSFIHCVVLDSAASNVAANRTPARANCTRIAGARER